MRRNLSAIIVGVLTLTASLVGVSMVPEVPDTGVIQESASYTYADAYQWCADFYGEYPYARNDCQWAAYNSFGTAR